MADPRPGVQVALSSIHFIQDSHQPLRVRKIVLYPYPDLTRLWFRLQLEAMPAEPPNIDIQIWNADRTENTSVSYVAYDDTFLDATLHLKEPQPADCYTCTTRVSTGQGADLIVLDAVRFEFPLEFRDAQAGIAGFGYDLADRQENGISL